MNQTPSNTSVAAQDRLGRIVDLIGGEVPTVALEQVSDSWTGVIEAVPTDPPEDHSFLLTVLIPVFNERATVAQVVTKVAAIPVPCQIIIVDDGSTDGTREALSAIEDVDGVEVVFHETNRGKGAALRSGLAKSQGRFVVIQDADLEYNPSEIATLIEPLLRDEADVVYGSRFLRQGAHGQGWLHRQANRCVTLASNLFTGLKLTDMETCYKAMKIETLDEIKLCQNRFGVEPELTAKLARRGARFLEVPISYAGRSFSEGKKVGLRDIFNAAWCIVRYGWSD